MKKDLIKYSQISIIVIAVILSVDFLGGLYKISYDRVYVPIRNELQSRKNQEAARIAGLKQRCITEAHDIYEKNLRNSCEVRKSVGSLSISRYSNLCVLDTSEVGNIDEFIADKEAGKDKVSSGLLPDSYWSTCKEYFFCDSDVISNAKNTLESDLKACTEKYPESK